VRRKQSINDTTEERELLACYDRMKKRKKKEGNQRNQILTRTHTHVVSEQKKSRMGATTREKKWRRVSTNDSIHSNPTSKANLTLDRTSEA
jgi:hypothetical protein